ncbi:MAG: AraC family transcriptional regulator [Polyangiaceae bacterium]|nr:AraC family transcriptional regulator [Polyangiaceae bacterium]
MWTRDGTVLTVSSRALVDACERLGVDTTALLEAAGVSRRTLADPDARLHAHEVGALWRKAYEMSGDPALSLHAAEACPVGAYKVIDFMGHNARTVGEAFSFAARYFKLVNTAVSLPIDASGDPVTLEIVDETSPEGVTRQYAEYCFAAFFLHIRGTTGVSFPIRRLQFTHRCPEDIAEHERLFACPIEFGASRTRMSIAREAWDTPAQHPHFGMLEVLAQHADLLLEKLPKGPGLVERTRRAISGQLRGGEPSLEEVAASLAMTPRTLQRHLRELGYSFNALADEVRQGAAGLYLQQPDIAIAEVAYLLGFADQSTFNRAFKRWYGVTPKQYRTRAA